ncbi:MAG: carbon storage regulator [Dehalococcoidia bacterium]
MLVLTRKIDQGIVISGNIYVRVLGVERDRVKIGISAPMDITVLRQELLNRESENGPKTEGPATPVPAHEEGTE